MRRTWWLIAVAGAAWSAEPAQWTVLGYLSGDGSLEPVALEYLGRLAAAPATDKLRVGAQIDRTPGWSDELDDFEDTRRVVFEQGKAGQSRRWRWSTWRTEVNMGDPRTLVEFLAWGAQTLPAKRYLVLLMGHGSGVRPLLDDKDQPRDRGVGFDATNGGDSLTPAEFSKAAGAIREALGNTKVSLLAVDACFSASAEMACEAAEFAEYITGSPNLLYHPGVPWDRVLRRLCAAPEMSVEEAAKVVVEAVRTAQTDAGSLRGTYAAARLSAWPEFESALSALSDELQRSMKEAAPAVTLARARSARGGLSDEMIDLGRFLSTLSEEAAALGLARVAELATDARNALDEFVIASYCGDIDAQNEQQWLWSAFFPPNLTAFPEDYLQSGRFARESGWGHFLGAYLGHLQRLVSPELAAVQSTM